MGFFKGGGGGAYVGPDEKNELAAAGATLSLTAVEFQEGEGFEGADRFLVTFTTEHPLEDREEGEDLLLSFGVGGVTSRDEGLEALAEYLETHDSYDVKLVKVGRAFILEDLEDDGEEPAKPAAKAAAKPKPAAKAKPSSRGTRTTRG